MSIYRFKRGYNYFDIREQSNHPLKLIFPYTILLSEKYKTSEAFYIDKRIC